MNRSLLAEALYLASAPMVPVNHTADMKTVALLSEIRNQSELCNDLLAVSSLEKQSVESWA